MWQHLISNLASSGTAIALVLSVAGCASMRTDLVRTGEVSLEQIPSSQAHFSRVAISRSDETVVVSGELHRQYHRRGPVPGHVDVVVLDGTGTVVAKVPTDYRRGSLKSRRHLFTQALPVPVMQGYTIRVVHHAVNS